MGKRPIRSRVNSSLNQARFKIRINRRSLDLGDTPEIIHLGNPADLTYTKLSQNLPILSSYNQWRIDKIVTHWRVLNKSRQAWRGDLVNHALVYSVPNDSSGADGTLEDLMFSTDADKLNNFLQNYTQLRGVYFQKVSWMGGKRAYLPFVSERITTLAKNTTATPTAIDDIRRNYAKTFRYASSAVRYEAPLFMMVPGLTKTTYDITGAFGLQEVNADFAINEFPVLEIWSDVYVTAKQYRNFSIVNPPTRLMTQPTFDNFANEIHTEADKVKEDVKHGIMDHIANSNPVLGVVAAVAGLRKRPRDEFKM